MSKRRKRGHREVLFNDTYTPPRGVVMDLVPLPYIDGDAPVKLNKRQLRRAKWATQQQKKRPTRYSWWPEQDEVLDGIRKATEQPETEQQ